MRTVGPCPRRSTRRQSFRTASTRSMCHPLLHGNRTARELFDLDCERKARPVHTATDSIKVLARDAELARRFLTGHARLIQPAREPGFALTRSTYLPLRPTRHRYIVWRGRGPRQLRWMHRRSRDGPCRESHYDYIMTHGYSFRGGAGSCVTQYVDRRRGCRSDAHRSEDRLHRYRLRGGTRRSPHRSLHPRLARCLAALARAG